MPPLQGSRPPRGRRLPENIRDMIDYYNLLGVRPTAQAAEIRSAFRRRAKESHPDAHPHLGPAEKEAQQRRFIQLAHAYETLAHPARRAEYDRKLRAARTAGQARTARPGPGRARPGPRAAPRGRPRRPPPPPPDDDADLDDLMQDVGDLLQRFGLDMRMQFADMLDKMLDWALSVFMEVVVALEKDKPAPPSGGTAAGAGGDAARPSGGAPGGAPPRDAPRRQQESPRRERPAAAPPPEPDFDAELAALKQQVHAAKRQAGREPPTRESVEEELERIKAGTRKEEDPG